MTKWMWGKSRDVKFQKILSGGDFRSQWYCIYECDHTGIQTHIHTHTDTQFITAFVNRAEFLPGLLQFSISPGYVLPKFSLGRVILGFVFQNILFVKPVISDRGSDILCYPILFIANKSSYPTH